MGPPCPPPPGSAPEEVKFMMSPHSQSSICIRTAQIVLVHMLSGCQVCDWGIQYHLCSTIVRAGGCKYSTSLILFFIHLTTSVLYQLLVWNWTPLIKQMFFTGDPQYNILVLVILVNFLRKEVTLDSRDKHTHTWCSVRLIVRDCYNYIPHRYEYTDMHSWIKLTAFQQWSHAGTI